MSVNAKMAANIVGEISRDDRQKMRHERLSDRELGIFRLLGSGRAVSDIAKARNLSVKTVSTHRTRIVEKTGAQSFGNHPLREHAQFGTALSLCPTAFSDELRFRNSLRPLFFGNGGRATKLRQSRVRAASDSMMKRIVVADDHPIVRRGLILILSETDDMTAIAAASHDELLSTLRSNQVEAVVMNIGFERSGIDGLRGMKKAFPLVPVLMFNTQADDLVPIRALRAGASGYIQKESSPEELIIAIRRLLAGGTYLSAGVAERIASNLSRGDEGGKPHERLSKRELEVFRDLGVGNSVGEIAEKLKLSVKTVSTHRARILEKTGLKNNADIIRYAITQHLV